MTTVIGATIKDALTPMIIRCWFRSRLSVTIFSSFLGCYCRRIQVSGLRSRSVSGGWLSLATISGGGIWFAILDSVSVMGSASRRVPDEVSGLRPRSALSDWLGLGLDSGCLWGWAVEYGAA